MAKKPQGQANGQSSMFDQQSSGRKHYRWSPKNKVVKSKSNSEKTTFKTPSGKEFSLPTTHGKFKRNKEEIETGKNKFTGEKLTDKQIGIRIGFNMALGEQSKAFKKSQSKSK